MSISITIDEHTFTLRKFSNNIVEVTADEESLSMLDDTIELAGRDCANNLFTKRPGAREMTEGTAAMWLQFEVLNYL